MIEPPDFKVFVRCFTYNQSQYIAEAMDSFCMQKTTFPYICCIVDDNSTDGEQIVIESYLKDNFQEGKEAFQQYETDYARITFARHNCNVNCYFVVLFLKGNLYSRKQSIKKFEYIAEWRNLCKYEAFCEGDDWWVSNYKLQSQFDIMEKHPEVDMCACGAECYQNGVYVDSITPSEIERILTAEEVIRGGGAYLATNSLFYRMDYLHDKYVFWKIMSIDYLIQIRGSLSGGIYYLPEKMAAYRMNSNGSWSIQNKKNIDSRYDTTMKVFSALDALNYETNGRYAESIDYYKANNCNVLFQQAFLGSKYDSIIKNIPTPGKIKIVWLVIKKLFA